MLDKNSFGSILERLREERQNKWTERKQWTVTAVAKRIGVSRAAYYEWVNGESLPDADNLKRIIAVFRPNEKDETSLFRAVAQLPPEKKKLPSRNLLFTGRNDYLDELHRQLQEEGSVALTQAVGISGLGGIGKTQIALEYAHRHHPDVYRTVLWVNAANRATLQADYDEVARLLELPERDEPEADRRAEAVKRWFDEHTRWLLIMDNADDLQLARSFMPGRLLGHIILTTRSQAIRESNIAVQLVIEEMKPREALIFLLRRAGLWNEEGKLDDEAKLSAVDPDVRDRATELVTLLGRLPLALDQAGAYIEAAGMTIADYIQLYQEERQTLLDTRGPPRKGADDNHPDTVMVTVRLGYRKVCERHAKAADILSFCLFLQPDAMPEELFYKDSEMQFTLRSFNDVMAALRRYSLVTRNTQEKLLSMHRMVQAVLIDNMPPDLQQQWRARVVRALLAAFHPLASIQEFEELTGLEVYDTAEFTYNEFSERLLPHVLDCATWSNDEVTLTVEFGSLLGNAGSYLHQLGRYSDSVPLLTRSNLLLMSLFEVITPKIAYTVASALDELATSYSFAIMPESAEFMYQTALEISGNALGATHSLTQRIRRNYEFFLHQLALHRGQAPAISDEPSG